MIEEPIDIRSKLIIPKFLAMFLELFLMANPVRFVRKMVVGYRVGLPDLGREAVNAQLS